MIGTLVCVAFVSTKMRAEAAAAPVCATVTADTRRYSAAYDESESGADRHIAVLFDTPRYSRLGLQNRRAPMRFLSHLPLSDLQVSTIRSVGLFQA